MRSSQVVIILPLLLRNYPPEEITLWHLLIMISGLQLLADMGFNTTFARAVAYAMGGATGISQDALKAGRDETLSGPNWTLLNQTCATMRAIYLRISLIFLGGAVILGSLLLIRPISALHNPNVGWASWVLVLGTSTLVLRNSFVVSFLQGTNNIALLRRWETVSSLLTISALFIGLLNNVSIVTLVIISQAGLIIYITGNFKLMRGSLGGRFAKLPRADVDKSIFESIWPAAWRSGVGVLMSYGVFQLAGLAYSQVAAGVSLASFLVSLRLIQTIRLFSQAPFYSKLPKIAQLYVDGSPEDQVRLAARGMRLSMWTFVAGVIFVGLFGEPALKLIGSNVSIVSQDLWFLIGIGFFFERYGAMHIQLFSATNKIIWHIANGVSGCIFLIAFFANFTSLAYYAYPVGLISGYLGFYCWYSALHSYSALHLKFFEFEKKTSGLPFATLLLAFCFVLFL